MSKGVQDHITAGIERISLCVEYHENDGLVFPPE